MNEILAGIRIIKFYAWEGPFGKEVARLRRKELAALTMLAYTTAIGFSMILMSAPLIQPILVFMTYVSIQPKALTASTAFTTVALFNIMRFPFAFLPMGLLQYIQSKISLRRLERYLDLPELAEYVEDKPAPGTSDDSNAAYGSITVVDGTFSWANPDNEPIRPINEKEVSRKSRRASAKAAKAAKADADMAASIHASSDGDAASVSTEATSSIPTLTLQNLSFNIEAGDLVAVVGPVGSGKSSFLSAILGEMEPIHDSKVYLPRPADVVPGFVSYCSQTPWVVNDTLRGNVLFGREFDQKRYNEVVAACALSDDLAVLPAGDETEIGERGINLSGGQKARVSLARALYSDQTRIILLDDPLSAVDAHVGEHIFANAITGALAKGVTRILVTHHVHLLSRCDKVIVLKHGRIVHCGKYSDLVAQGVEFAGAVDASKVKASAEAVVDPVSGGAVVSERKKEAVTSDETKAALLKSGKKLVKEEDREVGNISGSAYLKYARAGGKSHELLYETNYDGFLTLRLVSARFVDRDGRLCRPRHRQSFRGHVRFLVGSRKYIRWSTMRHEQVRASLNLVVSTFAVGSTQFRRASWRTLFHTWPGVPLSRNLCFIRYRRHFGPYWAFSAHRGAPSRRLSKAP
jgi:ABC-type multidrug transport system fused ATPase/permease subunit